MACEGERVGVGGRVGYWQIDVGVGAWVVCGRVVTGVEAGLSRVFGTSNRAVANPGFPEGARTR